MKNNSERLTLLYQRVGELRRRRDKTALILQGSGSAVLMTVLVAMVRMYSGNAETISLFTGSSLLDENTGGYVLVALIAFMAGTLLTAYLIKHRKPPGTAKQEKERGKKE